MRGLARSAWGSRLVVTGGAILLALVLVALLAPVLSPYDPRALSGHPLEPPSARHMLGTNGVGQDILSQVIWGSRSSLFVAVGAAVVAVGIGLVVGIGSGLLGGIIDAMAMRVVDAFLSLPMVPLAVLLAAVSRPGPPSTIIAVGIIAWPVVARVMRSQTLSLRQRGFVHASRGFGGGLLHVMARHLVPALGPFVVTGFINVAAAAVLLEAGLAFLGLGDPTAVSWGLIMNRALLHQGIYFGAAWAWWVLPAGLAITIAVLGFTFVGVGLEPRFNPRWTRMR